MKKILVISPEEKLIKSLQHLLSDNQYIFYWKKDLHGANLILSGAGDVDFVFVESRALSGDALSGLKDLVSVSRRAPVFLFIDALGRDLEGAALMTGVAHVLMLPTSGDLLEELLGRYEPRRAVESHLIAPTRDDLRQHGVRDQENRMLQIARSFIEVPRYAASSKAACQKTLSLLREMTGYRRMLLYFLKRPSHQELPMWKLELAFGVGRESTDAVGLTIEDGLGAHVIETGQIVQFDSIIVEKDPKILHIFRTLRLDAVIPVMADTTLLGVLMVGGRITGEPLNREELLLFHSLLENLGLYLRRSKSEALSSPVTEKGAAASGGPTDTTQQNQPIFNLLRDSYEEMPTAYLLVGQNDHLITANNAGRQLFNLVKENGHPLTTHQLPTALGHKISSVFSQSDDGLPIIVRLESPDSPILRCHVFPLKQSRYRDLPVVGVFVEQLKTAPPRESKSPNPEPASDGSTRVQPPLNTGKMDPSPMGGDLERTVYDKLARQIHYALVPLSTHAHLLDHGHFDEDFRDSLSEVLHSGIGRFSRFSRQLSYMVRHQYDLSEKTEIRKLVQSAFDEAVEYLEDPKATFELLDEDSPAIVRCEEVAIKFALAEVFLNALQANIGKPQFLVKFARKSAANEPKGIEIIVRDMGDGFEPEAMEKAFEPFFSTRPAGLGLGLSVARRILEGHFGHIHIRSTPAQNQHEVVIFLPTL